MIDVPQLLCYYHSKLSLLLTISQSRLGATQVLNAGFLSAVHASMLFKADPDLGLGKSSLHKYQRFRLSMKGFDNPQALIRYHELLLYVVRILSSIVLSHGPQNYQTIEQARQFLIQNRASVVSIFKRHAKIGNTQVQDREGDEVMDELVEYFVLLISLTDFLEVSTELAAIDSFETFLLT